MTVGVAVGCAQVEATAHVPTVPRGPTAARRYLAVGLFAVFLGVVHLKHRPATLCPFRAVTGCPCPFCGGTTAVVDLGHGNVGGAVDASPFAVGLLALGPAMSVFSTPNWGRLPRARWSVLATVVVVSEVWQLQRFGIIHL